MQRFIRAACGTALVLFVIVPPEAAEAARKTAPPSATHKQGRPKARRPPASSPPPRRHHHVHGRSPLVIRRVRVIRRDVFDTRLSSENKIPFKFVNALHLLTKESVVRGQLLLKEGDRYNADLAKESERALRNILHLRNVRVIPLPVNEKMVDLLVMVQDTWTTEPVFGVSGVGSTTNLKAGIREGNLLGYGKGASYFYKKTDGIISRSFSYDDPRLMGTPLVLNGSYQDQAEGTRRFLYLAKPFSSTITPWSVSGHFQNNSELVKELDNLGNETDRLWKRDKDVGGTIGVSAWSTTRRIRRPAVGYRRLESSTTRLSTGAIEERNLYHVFETGFDWGRVRYLTVNHANQYDRDEDFGLGPALGFTAGAARPKWTPTSDKANFFQGTFVQGWRFGPSHFGVFEGKGNGKFAKDKWDPATVSGDVHYFNHFQPRQTFVFHLSGEAILNPGPADQLLLGGDTGLRAYRINQFAGNKKILVNVEDRFFVLDDVVRFASVGAVVFSDAGNVWDRDHNIRINDVKSDVGMGLRLYLSRTSLGHVLRFDLSYALKRVTDQKRLVFTFGTSQAF